MTSKQILLLEDNPDPAILSQRALNRKIIANAVEIAVRGQGGRIIAQMPGRRKVDDAE